MTLHVPRQSVRVVVTAALSGHSAADGGAGGAVRRCDR